MSGLKKFVSETIIYGLGGVFSRAFVFFLIPLYTGFLGKTEYTNLIMLQSIFTVLSFALSLTSGVFFYYYEYKNPKYKNIVLTSWFCYQITVSILIVTLLIIFSSSLSKLFIVNEFNQSSLKIAIILIGLQLIPYSVNTTNINRYRIERKPKSSTLVVLLEALFTFISVYIVLKVLNLGLVEIMLAQLFSKIIVSLIYFKKSTIYFKINLFSLKLLHKIFTYAWPFIISSVFTWLIISLDKFIGNQVLSNKEDTALLALGMQIVLPIVLLADMVAMAFGPYVMSIKNESTSKKSYQQIYDLVIFISCFVVVLIVFASPMLVMVLADISYLNVIYVVPMMALARIFSLAANQVSIGFNLAKKNIYIMTAIVISGAIAVLINYFFMGKYGFIVSGVSQLISYFVMLLYLFVKSKNKINFSYRIDRSLILVFLTIVYIGFFYWCIPNILNQNYILISTGSLLVIILIPMIYFFQQKINPLLIIRKIIKRDVF